MISVGTATPTASVL